MSNSCQVATNISSYSYDGSLYVNTLLVIVPRTLITVLGLITSSLNLVMLVRSGQRDSHTAGLTFLTIVALLASVTLLLNCGCYIFLRATPGAVPTSLNLMIFYSQSLNYCVYEVTSWVSAFMSLHVTSCAAFPFLVKRLFTKMRYLVVISTLSFAIILINIPVFFAHTDFILEFGDSHILSGKISPTEKWKLDKALKLLDSPPYQTAGVLFDLTLATSIVPQVISVGSSIWLRVALRAATRVRLGWQPSSRLFRVPVTNLNPREKRLLTLLNAMTVTGLVCSLPKLATLTLFNARPDVLTEQDLKNTLWLITTTMSSLGISGSMFIHLYFSSNLAMFKSCCSRGIQ